VVFDDYTSCGCATTRQLLLAVNEINFRYLMPIGSIVGRDNKVYVLMVHGEINEGSV